MVTCMPVSTCAISRYPTSFRKATTCSTFAVGPEQLFGTVQDRELHPFDVDLHEVGRGAGLSDDGIDGSDRDTALLEMPSTCAKNLPAD